MNIIPQLEFLPSPDGEGNCLHVITKQQLLQIVKTSFLRLKFKYNAEYNRIE